jgi:hypothetical protein
MLEELSMQLEEAQERLPVLEDERKQAQQVNQDAAELAQRSTPAGIKAVAGKSADTRESSALAGKTRTWTLA